MNRIILIGNGFDLAHGLKTSYYNFIENLFYQLYNHVENKTEDELLSKLISFNKNDAMFKYDLLFDESKETKKEKYLKLKEYNPNKKIREDNLFLKSFILPNDNLNWGAIENIYYSKLIEIINNQRYELDTINIEINILNNDFETIIKLLEKYLIEIEEKSTNEINENILLNLEKTIQSNTISVDHLYDLAFSSKQKFIEQGSLDADYTMRKFIDKFFQKDNAYRPDDTLVVNLPVVHFK